MFPVFLSKAGELLIVQMSVGTVFQSKLWEQQRSVVTISKILLSVGFGRFLQKKPRFSVRFLSVPFPPCRQCGTFMQTTAHQTCSSTLHISVYNSSRQQKYPTECDWWRENHHLYPMSLALRNATCLAVCATDIGC